jgi:hypothetical protein
MTKHDFCGRATFSGQVQLWSNRKVGESLSKIANHPTARLLSGGWMIGLRLTGKMLLPNQSDVCIK